MGFALTGTDWNERVGLSTVQIVVLDLAGGTLGGVLAGVLVKFAVNWVGFVLVSQAVLFPVITLFLISYGDGLRLAVVSAALFAIYCGGIIGTFLWMRERPG